MKALKRILYLGEDNIFQENLEKYCGKVGPQEYEVIIEENSSGNLFNVLAKGHVHIVYVDFCGPQQNLSIFEEILFIKKYKKFKSVLFVALLSASPDELGIPHLFASGFQLSFIKGGEVQNVYSDAFYIAFNNEVAFPLYAKAKNIQQEMVLGVCSGLSAMSLDHFIVETDLDVSSDTLAMKLPMFKNLQREKFSIKVHHHGHYLLPMTESYVLNYPFAGPWDAPSESNMQKETVETWLEINKELMPKRKGHILVISRNAQLMTPFFNSTSTLPFHLDFLEEVDPEQIALDLKLKRPQLIFFDLDDEVEGKNGLEDPQKIIIMIKKIEGLNPIVVINNNTSRANALQKAFAYQNLIVAPHKLSIEMFRLFLNSLSTKLQISFGPYFYLRPSDPHRALEVTQKIMVTSLSEHEMTFACAEDLPMYTVLKISLPVPAYATIVPSQYELERHLLGKHFMAFIHGVNEEGLSMLRKFINQIIYRPMSVSFTSEAVEQILSQRLPEEQASLPQAPDKKENSKVTLYQRPTFEGKSKL